jgi:hypothetical protein
MKKIIVQILLGCAIVVLGYLCVDSIQKPQKFRVIKKQRYDVIIKKLKEIRKAQIAFKDAHGAYASNFDTLISFVKNDSIKMVKSIGSLSDDQLEAGMTEAEAIKKGIIIRDTMRISALDTLFGKTYPIENLRFVPFTKGKHEFKIGSSSIMTDAMVEVPVFEAKVSNTIIFEDIYDEYRNEILEENGNRIRINKYPGLKVGDIKEANNNVGNWE